MLNLPEWPAAETLLTMIVGKLTQNVLEKQLNEATKNHYVHILGQIASRIRQDILLSQEATILNLPNFLLSDKTKETCICGYSYEGSPQPMIECYECNRCFHIDCVGLETSHIKSQWLCDQCQIFQQINYKVCINFSIKIRNLKIFQYLRNLMTLWK